MHYKLIISHGSAKFTGREILVRSRDSNANT